MRHMVERSELQKMARTIDAHRKQLDNLHSRVEQVTAILEEHGITANILKSLQKSATSGRTGARLSIGSGVTLNYIHTGEEEGTALVDLGSGVYGEKPWGEALTITNERKEGISLLHKDLTDQATQLEMKITELAQQFNDAAATLQNTQESQLPPTGEKSTTQEKPRRPQRRTGRFGSELTLDD